MSKIFIDKKETIAAITDKIEAAKGDSVTLVIPRGSKLGEGNHLHLLKKHAEEAGKTLVIESIDEHVLALAEKQGLERIHPLFEGTDKRQTLSDIRPHVLDKKEHKAVEVFSEETEEESEEDEMEDADEAIDEEVVEKPKRRSFLKVPARFRRDVEEEEIRESEITQDYEDNTRPRSRRGRFMTFGVLGLIVLILFGVWGVSRALGRAEISITLKKTPWQSTATILTDKAPYALKAGGTTIPAMLFTEKKNTTQLFKASGKKQVSQKATAKVTVYNAFDSTPQTLVATTRLATPDGKIFRLNTKITVPGAKIEGGKITPAGIETEVTADQPGADYNIGPFDKMTIVGFKGTPKYNGFYGVMKDKAAGGLIGEAPYPTDEDVLKAEEKTRATLQSALDINIRRRIPEEFKILKDASVAQISKLVVNKSTDDQGNFSVLGEGQLSVIAFRESDVQRVFEDMIHQSYADQNPKTIIFEYTSVKPDFTNGKISLGVKADAVLTSPLDVETLKTQVVGKSLDGARQILSRLAGLDQAKIDIYPPWLWSMPGSQARVTVTVD